MDYTSVLQSYGYGKKDKFLSRMFIYPGKENNKSCSTYHFYYKDLIQELTNCSKNDLYISMNDFITPSRKEENVHRLKHLYVDLDTYHSAYAGHAYCNEYILQLLQEEYFGQKFPEPNLVVSSGRGLYLIWNIDEHKNALPRWKTVQKYLCQLLKDFGADTKVSTDAARVLRIPGSINTKSGKEVSILSENKESHNLYEFLAYYMPSSYLDGIRTHEKIRCEQKELGKKQANQTENMEANAKMEYKIASIHNHKTLLQARLHDLETLLIQFRDQEHGSKEYIFFLYRMWALQLYKEEAFVNQMLLQLNAKLTYKATESRLLAETRSAIHYYNNQKVRNMRNETIISFLSITEEEMKSMTTIISKEEAKIRKQARNKASYLRRLEENDQLTKQDNIQLRYQKIANFQASGYTKKEIAVLLGISYRQILRDCKAMEEISIDLISQSTKNLSDIPFSTNTNDAKMNSKHDVTNIKPYLLQDVVPNTIPATTSMNPTVLHHCYYAIQGDSMQRILIYEISNLDIQKDPLSIRTFLQQKGYSGQNITDLKKDPTAVWINDKPALLKDILHIGDQLKIVCMDQQKEDSIVATELPFPVVYEDDDIVVVNKPAGMSIHPSLNHYTDTLANAAKFYFTQKGEQIPFRCINRLDKDTSGLTIIAKHPISASILYQSMMERQIHREYVAIVDGDSLPDTGCINAPIGRKGTSIIERQIDYEQGEHAVTHYQVLKRENGMALLSLWLETGRTHQIRVHMKYLGYPLIGDDLYHPVEQPVMKRQALHSYCLDFIHPISGKNMHINAPIPEDMHTIMTISEEEISSEKEN